MPSLWFRSLLNIGHPFLYRSKQFDLRPEVLFPRLIGVVAAVVRGFDIFTHISKIFRKQRQWGVLSGYLIEL